MKPDLLGQQCLGDSQHLKCESVRFIHPVWLYSQQLHAGCLPYHLCAVTFGNPSCAPNGEKDQARLRLIFPENDVDGANYMLPPLQSLSVKLSISELVIACRMATRTRKQ